MNQLKFLGKPAPLTAKELYSFQYGLLVKANNDMLLRLHQDAAENARNQFFGGILLVLSLSAIIFSIAFILRWIIHG